jgi:NADH-quinone oxidoreductase subunit D
MKDSTQNKITINIGPVHPSTHGVLRFIVDISEDTIVKVDPEIGYVHRGVEKMAEMKNYNSFMPVADKLDYIAALNWEVLYADVIEKALNVSITPRTVYIRTIMCEIQRIMSHLLFLAHVGEDLGNTTLFMWGFRERELLMDVVEEVSGGRLAPMYMSIGGVYYDLPLSFGRRLLEVLDTIEHKVKNEYKAISYQNDAFRLRTVGVGVMSKEFGISHGLTGPNIRASGVKRDLRKDSPYLAYDKVDFEVITENDGDAYARFMVRINEILESIKILRQAIKEIPSGETKVKVPWFFKIPPKYTFVRHETPRGEAAMYLVTNGDLKPYRLKIRAPSFYAIQAIKDLLVGNKVADLVTILGSLDPVPGEIDR